LDPNPPDHYMAGQVHNLTNTQLSDFAPDSYRDPTNQQPRPTPT